MKQITPEIKARIFALYWGQRVWMRPHTNGETGHLYINTDTVSAKRLNIHSDYLSLFSLSSITDEDAEVIAGRVWTDESIKNGNRISDVKKWIEGVFGSGTLYSWEWDILDDFTKEDELFAVDYLRSQGYALPAFGYSVDDLVEAGVFKLKEVNND